MSFFFKRKKDGLAYYVLECYSIPCPGTMHSGKYKLYNTGSSYPVSYYVVVNNAIWGILSQILCWHNSTEANWVIMPVESLAHCILAHEESGSDVVLHCVLEMHIRCNKKPKLTVGEMLSLLRIFSFLSLFVAVALINPLSLGYCSKNNWSQWIQKPARWQGYIIVYNPHPCHMTKARKWRPTFPPHVLVCSTTIINSSRKKVCVTYIHMIWVEGKLLPKPHPDGRIFYDPCKSPLLALPNRVLCFNTIEAGGRCPVLQNPRVCARVCGKNPLEGRVIAGYIESWWGGVCCPLCTIFLYEL